MSAPSRAFSKLIHSPIVDKPSEVAGKTVARPSGFLGGSLFALAGTLILFWVVNKYGYEYNYLAVALLFTGGAIFGLLTELFVKLVRRP